MTDDVVPVVITTVEQLNALPTGTLLHIPKVAAKAVMQKFDGGWHIPGEWEPLKSEYLDYPLPAYIIDIPERS